MDRDGVRLAVRAFAVPSPLVAPVAAVLPFAELGVAVALILTASAVAGGMAALVLLGLFITGISMSLARGHQPDCRCFGQVHSAPVGRTTLVRNVGFAAAAVVVVAAGPGSSLSDWSSTMSGTEWLALGIAIALAVAFVFEGSLLLDKRRRSGRSAGRRPVQKHPD
ncbi:MAG: hypothetical protein QOF20_186 [Acidimicrobiaceae bacterium]|jgi:hypothetical protein|nr:hypothetical protein [Acidimicrobiaceae bacterium]MDQ1413519.1 hypothetical protein [Acidimicrobiaceae bacterium]MDQ1417629.1 hypothetical protein [Acidimicrobiaceae bacterium]